MEPSGINGLLSHSVKLYQYRICQIILVPGMIHQWVGKPKIAEMVSLCRDLI